MPYIVGTAMLILAVFVFVGAIHSRTDAAPILALGAICLALFGLLTLVMAHESNTPHAIAYRRNADARSTIAAATAAVAGATAESELRALEREAERAATAAGEANHAAR